MEDQVLEQYFTAIKQDFNHMDERFDSMDKRFDRVENWLEQIARNMSLMLEMHGSHDTSLKYHSSTLNHHERRISKLESQSV